MLGQRARSSERRNFGRRQVLRGGTIALDARRSTLPCVVRDLSEAGARLQVQQAASVPDRFELIIELDGLELPCEVVCREEGLIGVKFAAGAVHKAGAQAGDADPGTEGRAERAAAAGPPGDGAAALPTPPRKLARTIPIVIADDDPDDRMMIEDAFLESRFRHPFSFVEDGEELLRYLRADPPYEQRQKPGLVLLDLNMPRMDGRTALMHIRTDVRLRGTPVVVLTTSNAEEDIQRTYDLGVSGYVPKPSSLEGLLDLVHCLETYWMRMALPAHA